MASPYTEEQLNTYLKHIDLPPQYQCTVSSICKLDYGFLKALHAAQICSFPYENLSLHYTTTNRQVDIDPVVLYDKYMNYRSHHGRGGYCMEGNILFKHVLAGLGFNVFLTGARVRPRINGIPQGEYLGWVHCVNIVTLSDGSKYAVDVAFGGDGATKPVPMDVTKITPNIGTQDMRLIRDFIPGQTPSSDESQKLWIYQCRNGPEKPWHSFYAFSELEFLQQDFEVMNYFASTSVVGNFQTYTVLVIKFLRRDSEVYGKVMMVNGDVKVNDTGQTKLVLSCKSERDRIDALADHFGIQLTEDEVRGIKGLGTELIKS